MLPKRPQCPAINAILCDHHMLPPNTDQKTGAGPPDLENVLMSSNVFSFSTSNRSDRQGIWEDHTPCSRSTSSRHCHCSSRCSHLRQKMVSLEAGWPVQEKQVTYRSRNIHICSSHNIPSPHSHTWVVGRMGSHTCHGWASSVGLEGIDILSLHRCKPCH
jgi:hypothetical protein